MARAHEVLEEERALLGRRRLGRALELAEEGVGELAEHGVRVGRGRVGGGGRAGRRRRRREDADMGAGAEMGSGASRDDARQHTERVHHRFSILSVNFRLNTHQQRKLKYETSARIALNCALDGGQTRLPHRGNNRGGKHAAAARAVPNPRRPDYPAAPTAPLRNEAPTMVVYASSVFTSTHASPT